MQTKDGAMHWLRFAFLVLTALMLQTNLVEVCAVTAAQIKPDLLLILLISTAIR